ncbi:peptide deformylase [Corynebacterium tapiri]|uniref:Peptide deformylase n=1 Tax=Corynebacterium tapiri TaxID=1448266 RepID=A0A5C4U5Y6_9CORY|nr:peptide deformylase [Corynebacterium tapiri]TNL97793.1 peptide deformylase [Corynebacterium tapiri]
MSPLDVRLLGDPVLKTRAADIPLDKLGPDSRYGRLVDDMLETMDHAGGVGLAANQVGLLERIIVFDASGMRGHLINPVITPLGQTRAIGVEGCLSIPGVRAPVERPACVVARGVDKRGASVSITATGLLARCLQHEVDHLDGILFYQRLSAEERRRVNPLLRDLH